MRLTARLSVHAEPAPLAAQPASLSSAMLSSAASLAEFSSAAGKAKYDAKKHALVWKIKRFPGASEHSLAANVELIATTKEKKPWSRAPISLTFQARCFCVVHPGCSSCA